MLFIQFFLILTNREYGPMLWAERRALRSGKLVADTANVSEIKMNHELEPKAVRVVVRGVLGFFAGFRGRGRLH